MTTELYDRSQEPAVISKPLSDLLLKQDKPAELMALYWFYYYTAKWQQTNQPKATNPYVAKALHWSSVRVGKIGKILEGLGLIEKIKCFDKDRKTILGHYVKVNFIWGKDKQPYLRKAILKESHSMANHSINALSSNISNALSSNKKRILQNSDQFDPEDLPAHLGNNKAVAEAWSRFVQSRKEIKKRITPVAYKMLIKKMLAHSPEEVVAALDTSSERGYTGVFFNDNPPTRTHTVQGDMFPVKLDPDAQRLANFAASVLGNELIRPRAIQDIVNQMRVFYGTADKFRYQYDPLKRMGPTEHYTWDKFFREWLEFLEEKQQSGFTLQSVRNLQQSDTRWREYLKQCEEYTGYDWNTGKRRE